jgi:hypothetical protein
MTTSEAKKNLTLWKHDSKLACNKQAMSNLHNCKHSCRNASAVFCAYLAKKKSVLQSLASDSEYDVPRAVSLQHVQRILHLKVGNEPLQNRIPYLHKWATHPWALPM